MTQKNQFAAGEFFHVFNKSIANFGIFKTEKNKKRFLQTLDYYNSQQVKTSLSVFLRNNYDYLPHLLTSKPSALIKFIAYCIMPDHYHLLIKILAPSSLSKYINDVENSYTRFFNLSLKRKGPLWQSRFKAVRIASNEQLLHVSRYIHLNPTVSNLVDKPEDWQYSSYFYYLNEEKILKKFLPEISISNQTKYKKFVENQKDYQIKLKLIKKLTLE